MFRKFLGERILCGLDIGDASLKVGIVKLKNSQSYELLAVEESPTHGFRESSVSNLSDFADCIQATLSSLMKKAGVKLRELYMGMGSSLVEDRRSQAVLPLLEKGSKVITRQDVKKAIAQARLLGLKVDEEALHEFPQQFEIDGVNRASNPLGLYGRKLQVDLSLIVAYTTHLNNLTKAVHQAGYEVENIFWNTYAATKASLTDQMKTDGCVLINIGTSTTEVLIFTEGVLRFLHKIPLAGEYVTSRIVQDLGVTFDAAEEMKKSYGMAASGEEQKNEDLLVKKEDGYFPLKRGTVGRSIEPVVTELVLSIEKAIRGPFYPQLKAGCRIIGGGALLPGLLEMIEREVNLPVSMGKIHIQNSALNNSAIFSAAVGLALLGSQRDFSYDLTSSNPQGWWRNLSGRLQELYQEYF